MTSDRPARQLEHHPVIERVVRKMSLSKRESAVVRLLVSGRTTAEVATRLGIQETTVCSHLRKVFKLTGVRSRAQLVTAILQSVLDESDREQQGPAQDTGEASPPDTRLAPPNHGG